MDPEYVAKRLRQQELKAENILKQDVLRRGRLTAITGAFAETKIDLAIFSDENYRMARGTWNYFLTSIEQLLVRKPDFKGIIQINERRIPVVGFVGALGGKVMTLDLFVAKIWKIDSGNLQQIATGYMRGENDAVQFRLHKSGFIPAHTINCQLVVEINKPTDTPRHHYVIGEELYSRMFASPKSMIETHNSSEDLGQPVDQPIG